MHYPPMLPGRRRRPGDEADQEKRLQGLSRGYEDSPWLTALVDFSGFLVVLVGSFTAWWGRMPACERYGMGGGAPGNRALGITDEGRDRRLAADSVAQVQHPVALDHCVRVFEQMLGIDRPEVPLA